MSDFGTHNYIANLSIDCVIFGYEEQELKVLIAKCIYGDNLWNLPGGHILRTESIEAAASRILEQRTGLKDIYLEQFRVFGHENRILESKYRDILHAHLTNKYDESTANWITDRFVCIGFYALVDISKVNPQKGELDEKLELRGIKDIPEMLHDHQEILNYALEALRQNLDQKLIGFNLLPETFTMKEVQELYEAVYDREFPMNNFQRKMLQLGILERLEKKFTGASNKAPYLYRFKK
ncbi:NUDIX hydrolase [Jiulongibacter sediminis]|uniref:NUDIX hydrolase n=1 Tax=Jiulongibacter sediminis TaxID=1605367 RepID=A0A0P7C4G3_9BACT|nr:NUDIX domain-containing protein [Jiulongibacter sediminis]KPM49227.1 NUDIX hydrolase [Jiulongibacter sediminis]TBX26281.1 NUDIX hydrolase [Jiulongibacter sediminis]